jgi:DNA-directed RNA polymerase subunit RPC12/RpoP
VITRQIKSKCKRCGREAISEEFILDPIFKMMVCPECVKERKNQSFVQSRAKVKEQAKAAAEAEKKSRPAGWDAEDSEIERAFKTKQSSAPKIEKIDDEHVKYTCKKCKYEFVFNVYKRMPGRCPYCGAEVQGV